MNFSGLTAIVVIYNQKLYNSDTLSSLNTSVDNLLDVIIYDNSEESSAHFDFAIFQNLNIKYYHNPHNPGICSAYNYALQYASKCNKNWLLLLDQDTNLTRRYFVSLAKAIDNVDPDIVSISPKVLSKSNKEIISPLKILPGGIVKPLMKDFGIILEKFTAVNSGTAIKVSFLHTIGGFDNSYKLDMLDYWFFREMHYRGKLGYLLDTEIIHDLSVGDFNSYMSINRYKQLLISEKRYYETDGWFSYQVYKTRLLVRSVKFAIHSKGKYAIQTIRQII